ncbi:hypothetical protein HK104_006068 [Borealophlyctis nickersoniae]|nr:hypothetical protein HK104_006068 [Borealophlyctis nickersoniae]
MDSLLTRTVLPKLVQTLRLDFSINPAAQDTTPLLWIFRWHALLPGHLLVHLLETEFFPVWHRILWAWLSSPGANHDEIVQWYTSWKSFFPPFLQAEEGIKRQFKAGLDFMNRALSGGAGGVMPPIPGPIALEKAGVGVGLGANGLTSAQAAEKIREDKRRKAATAKSNEVTFREYVERVASARDGKVHPQTGKPLFLMAEGGGVGGLLCYIEDGVVFVSEGEKWVPVSVEEAVERVVKGKGKR